MATKAERFRTESQRTGRDRENVPKPARPPSRRARSGQPDKMHNLATVRGARSSYELEPGGIKGSSRRSTRKSHNRQKTDSGLRLTRMNRNVQPEAQARRRR